MAGKLSWRSQQHTLLLHGDLDCETLLPLWQQRDVLLADKTCIDVAQLQRVDSSGLALLVHLHDKQYSGVPLKISGISDRLATLINLYNLQNIITLKTMN